MLDFGGVSPTRIHVSDAQSQELTNLELPKCQGHFCLSNLPCFPAAACAIAAVDLTALPADSWNLIFSFLSHSVLLNYLIIASAS